MSLLLGHVVQLIVLEPGERVDEQLLTGQDEPEQTEFVDSIAGVGRGVLWAQDVESNEQRKQQAEDADQLEQEGEDREQHVRLLEDRVAT